MDVQTFNMDTNYLSQWQTSDSESFQHNPITKAIHLHWPAATPAEIKEQCKSVPPQSLKAFALHQMVQIFHNIFINPYRFDEMTKNIREVLHDPTRPQRGMSHALVYVLNFFLFLHHEAVGVPLYVPLSILAGYPDWQKDAKTKLQAAFYHSFVVYAFTGSFAPIVMVLNLSDKVAGGHTTGYLILPPPSEARESDNRKAHGPKPWIFMHLDTSASTVHKKAFKNLMKDFDVVLAETLIHICYDSPIFKHHIKYTAASACVANIQGNYGTCASWVFVLVCFFLTHLSDFVKDASQNETMMMQWCVQFAKRATEKTDSYLLLLHNITKQFFYLIDEQVCKSVEASRKAYNITGRVRTKTAASSSKPFPYTQAVSTALLTPLPAAATDIFPLLRQIFRDIDFFQEVRLTPIRKRHWLPGTDESEAYYDL
jgi:hypothetical protein